MSIQKIVLAMATASLALTGCGDAIEGDWQSREKLSNDERNRLTFEADGVGSAKIYARFAADGPLSKIKFETEWEIDDNGDYDVTATCDSGCVPELETFEMECSLGDGDLLDCKAKAPLKEYGYLEFEPFAESE
jgi:hypothetical protein